MSTAPELPDRAFAEVVVQNGLLPREEVDRHLDELDRDDTLSQRLLREGILTGRQVESLARAVSFRELRLESKLYGRLAIHNRFLDEETVREALAEQKATYKEGGTPRSLAEMLRDRDRIDPDVDERLRRTVAGLDEEAWVGRRSPGEEDEEADLADLDDLDDLIDLTDLEVAVDPPDGEPSPVAETSPLDETEAPARTIADLDDLAEPAAGRPDPTIVWPGAGETGETGQAAPGEDAPGEDAPGEEGADPAHGAGEDDDEDADLFRLDDLEVNEAGPGDRATPPAEAETSLDPTNPEDEESAPPGACPRCHVEFRPEETVCEYCGAPRPDAS